MTRTNKWTVHEAASKPKWFTHNGHFNTDPTKVRKNGAGRNNWGQVGDELIDDDEMNIYYKNSNTRRNSNHNVNESHLQQLNQRLDNKLM